MKKFMYTTNALIIFCVSILIGQPQIRAMQENQNRSNFTLANITKAALLVGGGYLVYQNILKPMFSENRDEERLESDLFQAKHVTHLPIIVPFKSIVIENKYGTVTVDEWKRNYTVATMISTWNDTVVMSCRDEKAKIEVISKNQNSKIDLTLHTAVPSENITIILNTNA